MQIHTHTRACAVYHYKTEPHTPRYLYKLAISALEMTVYNLIIAK